MCASSSLYFAKTICPLGEVLLVAQTDALTGLYFTDQPDCPFTGLNAEPRSRADNPWSNVVGVNWPESASTSTKEICPDQVNSLLNNAIGQLDDWFSGRRTTFDLPLRLQGTPFQRAVWQTLLGIRFGQCLSYGEISTQVMGSTRGSRAVGVAIGKNPISIIVPCHRVVGRNGQLTGYSGGLARKSALLAHEGSLLV